MRVSRQLRRSRFPAGEGRRQGYVLLAILLVLTLMAIAAAAAAPDIALSIRRERERELINRGTQYMRAIQHYYKKFGRYPVRIEDLENTSNMRFLRRRYKDPITGKDFRLVHFGEPLSGLSGMGAPGMPGGMMGGAAAAAMSGAFGQNSGGLGQNQAPNSGMFSQGPSGPGGMMSPGGLLQPGQSQGESSGPQGEDALAGKAFGGGPIIGVASTSHAASIREFNKKNHYNDWYFVYEPMLDRGGLIRGPAQPPLAGTGGSVVGTPGTGPISGPGGMSPGGVNPGGMSPNSPFGGPLQGPGAMVPQQPQQMPQQQ